MTASTLSVYAREYVGALRFDEAVDLFIRDMRSLGRINSRASERSYRGTLGCHGEDVSNHDPRTLTRDDVKRTLRRWSNPNSQRTKHSALNSFYDWCMEEGIRKDNPARQVRRAKKQPTSVYRLTKQEVVAMLRAARGTREVRVMGLGFCAGLRNAELRGLRGCHFQRPGFIHVSADIAKGGRERWVPVMAELLPVVEGIRVGVGADEYVLPAQRMRGVGNGRLDLTRRPSSSQALRSLVMEVAARAGIRAHIHPHLMRHAFGDHVARYAGLKRAQTLMGHADSKTTEGYTGAVTLDELAEAMSGFAFIEDSEQTFVPPDERAAIPHKATTGIEPVEAPRLRLVRDHGLPVEGWGADGW